MIDSNLTKAVEAVVSCGDPITDAAIRREAEYFGLKYEVLEAAVRYLECAGIPKPKPKPEVSK